MTNQIEKSVVKKGRSSFKLVGEVILNEYSFKQDVISDRSGYQYSSCNIGVRTKNGLVTYCESMGGFFPNGRDVSGNPRENLLYVNSKDDFMDRFTIGFEDRFNENITDPIHGMNFCNVGVALDENEKIIQKRFLSEYDMIEYLEEHLHNGDVVSVSGDIEYSVYNDEVQARKQIRNIFISSKPKEEYEAVFTQTILLNKDSIDRPKDGEIEIFAQVPEYISKMGQTVVKNTLALPQQYVMEDSELSKKLISNYMKVKKGNITEITVDGEFQSSVQTGVVTDDELSPDMIELVELGLFTKEQALDQQNSIIKGDRGREVLVIKKPHLRKGKEDNTVIISYCLDKYKEEELLSHYMYTEQDDEDNVSNVSNVVVDEDGEEVEGETVSVGDTSWLNDL